MLIFAGSAVAGGTGAFFSDTETSTDNSFTAGALDLTVDNTSYYNGSYSAETSWELANLDDGNGPADGSYLFFNFNDLKPGDWGEDTISLHVHDNPSWACMNLALTATDDNGLTEPEAELDSTEGPGEGELQDELHFAWWLDDGDNVYEDDETLRYESTLASLDGASIPIADSSEDSLLAAPLNSEGLETYYLAKAWCYGDLAFEPVEQDDEGLTQAEDGNGPDVRNSGITCEGAGVTNLTQTDSVELDVLFYAVQARHNEDFVCEPSESDGGGDEPQIAEGEAAFSAGAGVHYRSFLNQETDPPDEVYLGADIGLNPKRNEQDIEWLHDVSNAFEFSYTPGDDEIASVVNADPELTYDPISIDALCPVGDWDVLQISMKGEQNDTVDIEDLEVNGVPFGTLAGSATEKFWTITGFDLSLGFTVTGGIVITSPVTNNGDGNNVKMLVGCST